MSFYQLYHVAIAFIRYLYKATFRRQPLQSLVYFMPNFCKIKGGGVVNFTGYNQLTLVYFVACPHHLKSFILSVLVHLVVNYHPAPSAGCDLDFRVSSTQSSLNSENQLLW